MNVRQYGVVVIAAVFAVLSSTTVEAAPELRGRLLIDYAFHDSDQTELADGHRVRRARLGATGDADENWQYKLELDFAENDLTVKDAYIRYTGFATGDLTLGHFKAPFGMDDMTSSNHVPFIERALPISFAPGRGVGVGYDFGGDNYGVSSMLFGSDIGSADDRAANNSDEGISIATRAYASPIRSDNNILHLGGAFTAGDAGVNADDTVRFSSRPESRVSGVRLVDTGAIADRDNILRLGLEAAYQTGPLTLQAEYLAARVNGMNGAPDYDFDGYYGQASYVFGGSSRVYRGGTFRAPSVGAWEVAARYSNINLDDEGVEGGEENNITLGVNYYAARNIRFMMNYIMVDSERAGLSDDPNILMFRAQVSF